MGPMFREVVGTIFAMMKHFDSFWTKVKYSRPTAIYGFGLGETEMPPEVKVDTENLMNKFQEGFKEYIAIWEEVLTEDVCKKLLEIKGMKENEFNFPTDLWARVLFDMAVGYQDSTEDTSIMMDSLISVQMKSHLLKPIFLQPTRKCFNNKSGKTARHFNFQVGQLP